MCFCSLIRQSIPLNRDQDTPGGCPVLVNDFQSDFFLEKRTTTHWPGGRIIPGSLQFVNVYFLKNIIRAEMYVPDNLPGSGNVRLLWFVHRPLNCEAAICKRNCKKHCISIQCITLHFFYL